jgi:hypothetical protein
MQRCSAFNTGMPGKSPGLVILLRKVRFETCRNYTIPNAFSEFHFENLRLGAPSDQ